MNQDITVVMNQKRSRFVRAEVVVCIDTADGVKDILLELFNKIIGA